MAAISVTVPWCSAMVTLNSRELHATLLEPEGAGVASTALAWLYKAYAQTKLSEAGVFVDLDAVWG